MTARKPTVAIHYVRLLTDYCDRHELPARSLLPAVGIDPRLLDERDARLPFSDFGALFTRAATALRDPCLGLHAGQSVQPGHFGPFGFTLASARTVRVLLDRCARYSGLVQDACYNVFQVEGNQVVRYWRPAVRDAATPWALIEQLNAADWITMARWLIARPDARPSWVAFRHRRPGAAELREYEQVFRCPLRFGAKDAAIAIDARILDWRLPQASPEVFRMMDALCERLHRRFGSAGTPAWLAVCRQAILDGFAAGIPELPAVAASAGLSARELRRRLAQRQSSFRRLADELRRDLALDYLADPSLSLIDVACLTGFSEQSCFQRAFRRWTGATPRAYRQRLDAGSGDRAPPSRAARPVAIAPEPVPSCGPDSAAESRRRSRGASARRSVQAA